MKNRLLVLAMLIGALTSCASEQYAKNQWPYCRSTYGTGHCD